MDYIVDNNIVYIAINNKHNKFCYHVSVIQYLHTSHTLNEFLNNLNLETYSNDKLIYNMILPLKTYASINTNNYKDVYLKLKNDYNVFIENIVNDKAKDGYYPEILLIQHYLPVLYHITSFDVFEHILNDLHIKRLRFYLQSYNVTDILKTYPYLKDVFYDEIYKYNINMINDVQKFHLLNNYPFKCAILEMYPYVNKSVNGHAVFILKSDKYYVFDDSNYICEFKNYVLDRKFTLSKITIRNVDEQTVQELSKLWSPNVLTRKINDRYEFTNFNNETTMITGGDLKKINIWLYISLALFLILIIESIFAILNMKKKQTFKPPCNCSRYHSRN